MLFPTILTYTTLKNVNLKNLPPATVSGQLFVDATSNLEYLGKTDIVINSKIKK